MACCCCRYTTGKRKKEEECDTRPQIHLLPPSDHLSRSFLLPTRTTTTHTHRVSRQSFLGSPLLATSSVAFRPSGWQHVRSAVSNRIFSRSTSSPFCFGLARKRTLKDSGGNTSPAWVFFRSRNSTTVSGVRVVVVFWFVSKTVGIEKFGRVRFSVGHWHQTRSRPITTDTVQQTTTTTEPANIRPRERRK